MRLLLVLMMSALVGACSSQSVKSPTLPDTDGSVDLSVSWRATLGNGPGSSYTRLKAVVRDDTVYAADTSGIVSALNLENGRERWSTQLDFAILGGVSVAGEQLFVSTNDGSLVCLDTATGDVVWITQLSSEAVSPASTDDARVFVQTVDGRTSAFERADGKQAWSYQTAAPVLTVRGTGAPVVLEQLVVTGFATGKVVALDKALGIPRWNVRLASPDGRSELERLVDVDGAPIWDNGILYAAAYHGKIAAISQMGETIWEEDGSSYTSPELALGSLYLTLEDDSIQSYDMVNGAKAWKQTALTGREVGQVTAIGTQLAVADGEGYVHTMSQVDGHITGRILLRPRPIHMSFPNQGEATNWRALRGKDFGIRSTLVATDAGLLVYTNTGELLLLNVES